MQMFMPQDYSNKNLQKAVLQNKDFSYANFSGSDLRGADFTGSDLTGADLSNVRTGLTPVNVVLIFILALAVSLFSGYLSAQVGLTIRGMLADPDSKVRLAGIISIVITSFCLLFAFWKGGTRATWNLIIFFIISAIAYWVIAKIFGCGTGKGALYFILALLLLVVMVYVGVIARTVAGDLSHILFMIVALSGGIFGKSIAGGVAPLILAISCVIISKKVLGGGENFAGIRKIAFFITSKFGTSFRNAKLTNTDFSGSRLHNADFTGANLTTVKWNDAKKINCKDGDAIITDKKRKHD
jgi:hypothetical protein